MLGMALMTIMSNSLILLGISTYWQKVFTGAIIPDRNGSIRLAGFPGREERKKSEGVPEKKEALS